MAHEVSLPANLILVRGGGDLATGIVWRLTRMGWPVLVTELANPLTVRRTVSLSTAVRQKEIDVNGMIGRLCPVDPAALAKTLTAGEVPVVVSPDLPNIAFAAVVDARLAKRNIDTSLEDAPIVIGVGPGFNATADCHAVVETNRGPNLGRVIWEGSAEPNTGTPGLVAGRGRERVLRSPAEGEVAWSADIGDLVVADQVLGTVDGHPITAPFDGVIRGLIIEGPVRQGLKVGDVDPRGDVSLCHQISDKALAVGGGVVEAVGWLQHQ